MKSTDKGLLMLCISIVIMFTGIIIAGALHPYVGGTIAIGGFIFATFAMAYCDWAATEKR